MKKSKLSLCRAGFQGTEGHRQSEKLNVAGQTYVPLRRKSTDGEDKDSCSVVPPRVRHLSDLIELGGGSTNYVIKSWGGRKY